MKLLLFELKKYVIKPSVIVCLAIFAIINFVKFFEIYFYFGGGRFDMNEDTMSVGYSLLYEKYGGNITDEKIDLLKAERQEANSKLEKYGMITEPIEDSYCGFPSGDVLLIDNIINDYEYALFYWDDSNKKASFALENMKFYESKSEYEVRKNALIYSTFKNRKVCGYVKADGWIMFFDYKFSAILAMLLISLILSPIFSSEKTCGFNKIIVSSGKSVKTVYSKLAAASLLTFFVTMFFWCLDLLYAKGIYGLYCLNVPIYGISEYADCPLYITLLGAVLLAFLSRLIFLLFFMSAVMIISSFCRSNGMSLTVSILFGGVLILLSEIIPSKYSPINLLSMSGFFKKFDVINLLGFPVLTVFFSIGVTLFITLCLLFITVKRGIKC